MNETMKTVNCSSYENSFPRQPVGEPVNDIHAIGLNNLYFHDFLSLFYTPFYRLGQVTFSSVNGG